MVRTLRKLAADDQRLLRTAATAAVWLFFVDLGLRTIGLRRIRALLQRLTPATPPAGHDWEPRIDALQTAVDVAARHHLYSMTCLPRSLVLQTLLARAGVQSELRLGVRKTEGRLEAHAWVERQARPVGEPLVVTSRFAPLVAGETVR